MFTVGILIVLFFILGMFLSLIGDRPRSDAEWQSDTETGEEIPIAGATPLAPR